MTPPALIAHCPVHGYGVDRRYHAGSESPLSACGICGGPVDHVPMVPLAEHEEAMAALRAEIEEWKATVEALEDPLSRETLLADVIADPEGWHAAIDADEAEITRLRAELQSARMHNEGIAVSERRWREKAEQNRTLIAARDRELAKTREVIAATRSLIDFWTRLHPGRRDMDDGLRVKLCAVRYALKDDTPATAKEGRR